MNLCSNKVILAFIAAMLAGALIVGCKDKHSFTVFRHDPNDPSSLRDDYISSICEDRSGVLWIGTWEGWLDLTQFGRQSNPAERDEDAPRE